MLMLYNMLCLCYVLQHVIFVMFYHVMLCCVIYHIMFVMLYNMLCSYKTCYVMLCY